MIILMTEHFCACWLFEHGLRAACKAGFMFSTCTKYKGPSAGRSSDGKLEQWLPMQQHVNLFGTMWLWVKGRTLWRWPIGERPWLSNPLSYNICTFLLTMWLYMHCTTQGCVCTLWKKLPVMAGSESIGELTASRQERSQKWSIASMKSLFLFCGARYQKREVLHLLLVRIIDS